jgi:predicted nucleic acid-binding protein
MVNVLSAMVLADPPLGTHEAADPDDRCLLALAETARAKHPVTGDRRAGLLTRRRLAEAQILIAAGFLDCPQPTLNKAQAEHRSCRR